MDLLIKLLRYHPDERLHPFLALAHPFFDSIRDADKVSGDDASFIFELTQGKSIELIVVVEMNLMDGDLFDKIFPPQF